MKSALQRLTQGRPLSQAQAAEAMTSVLSGSALPAQIAGFAAAITAKGITVDEMVGLVQAARGSSVTLPVSANVLDTCGTGGDGHDTFNISTTVAVVAAACGIRVAKHGNRSASSNCGSADVLEALGVRIDLSPPAAAVCLERVGITFLYAPMYLPAFRHAAQARRDLGVRTVFNFLGPLCNPAGAKFQILGVADPDMAPIVAETLIRLGTERAMVFTSEDGLDELSLSAPSRVIEIRENHIHRSVLLPTDAGISAARISDLRGGNAATNASILRRILAGEPGPHRDIVLLNTAAALRTAGRGEDWRAAVDQAARAIDSGAAGALLDKWIAVSQEISSVRPDLTGDS
ncbi:anthranilate phosphoribosyltransferase [Streptomyces sp. NPDC058664]|uniref:anthranilate phosphoribosyltransferase n=1 Tax=unclassified Streptomyces TaxID=2593676 RepID=UPI00365BB663